MSGDPAGSGEYRFRHTWRLAAELPRARRVLAALEHYPDWWAQVRSVQRVDDNTAKARVRSVLPYTLDLQLMRSADDVGTGALRVRIGGDLHGWAQWRLAADGPKTIAEYAQEVTVQGWLGAVGRPLAPLLRANHTWMM